MSSEKTPLTDSGARAALNYSYYGDDAGIRQFYTRRRKEKELQCITFVIVIAVFIMALVIAISYSINDAVPLVADTTNPEEVPPAVSLKSVWMMEPSSNVEMYNRMTSTTLTSEEWNEAIKAGSKAIASREAADALATPLPAPSPNSRHQYAVKTSLQAGRLAMAGIGELAATKNVEQTRTRLGAPSSVGAYFKNIWAPDDTCKEFAKITCPPSKYRNYDGTCNHPKNYGAALTPFVRKLPPVYADGFESPRIGKFGKILPSAREISLKIHPPSPSSNPSFTVMLAVFGQFLDHDITATALSQGTNGSSLTCCPTVDHDHPECFPVRVETGDPVYDLTGRDCMEFVRSAPAPQCKIGPRQQLNQVTSFIDGSVIYGPDIATAQTLREGQNGLLRMFKTPDNRTLLPQSTDPNDGCNRAAETARGRYCFASGDGRANENLHLTTMHLLWARQHNRVATGLRDVNPSWSDETIYQETRRILGAQLQHITYEEFVPTVIGDREVNLRQLRPMKSGFRMNGYSPEVNPSIANSFAAAAFRFAHTLLPGLMRVTDVEKSTSSYVELHRMLFNPYSLYAKGGMESSLTAATSNSIQRTTTHVTSQLTKHLFEDPLSNATIPCGLDLVSLNIQRGRDHGLPGYTAWRRYCGLGKVDSFEDLRGQLEDEALDGIAKLYADVDDVDLYTGALAEIDKADGLVGPTFRCLIGDQFSRIQQGDRFWYEVPGEVQSFTEGQLKEIRKTSLAKLICECSDEINVIQPLVMRSVDSENPMTSCEDIPDVDLKAWRDASSPILKATATGIPETWMSFKDEINKTVRGIVDFFGKPVAAGETPDWTTFKDWVNKSFADIRNEVSELRPKPVMTLADEPTGSKMKKDKFKEFYKFPGASGFDRKIETTGETGGQFNYMQFAMDRSVADLDEYSKTATIQSTTYDDWIAFKNDVKKILNDALTDVTGAPTPEQREELKSHIAAEIAEIKSEIASVKTIEPSLIREKMELADATATADWLGFKDDVVKAVTDAVDRIKTNAPLPGDPAWAIFGSDIKNQFAGVKNHIPVLPSKKMTVNDPSAVAYWDNFRDSLNKTINDAVADLDNRMPAPGDPAWSEFGAMIKNEFSGLDAIPKLQAKAPKVPKPKDPAFATYWNDFKDSLNKSISNAVADIAAKSPSPGDPAWSAFGAKIMNDFSVLKDKFAASKANPILQAKETTDDPAIAAYWNDFRTSLNASINNAVAEIAGKGLAPGDPAWGAFGAKIMTDFAGLKDKFAALHGVTGNLQAKVPKVPKPKDPAFATYWNDFKDSLNKSISNAVADIAAKSPSPGDPAWSAFGAKIMNDFSALKDKFAASKANPILQAKETTDDPAIAAYWNDFRTTLNASINSAVAEIAGKGLAPGDPAWGAFGAKIMTDFAGLKDKFAALHDVAGKIKEQAGAADNIVPFDWFAFKTDIINSVADTVNTIKKNMPPPGSPAWTAFKGQVMNGFAKIPGQPTLSLKLAVNETPEKKLKPTKKVAFDWMSFKDEINKSVTDIINDKETAAILPPGDPKWADFGAKFKKFNTTFNVIKSEIDEIRPKPDESQFSILRDDWMDFKEKINKSMIQTIDLIKSKTPLPGDPGWMAFRDSIKDEFAALKNEIDFVKSEASLKASVPSKRIVQMAASKAIDGKPSVRETQSLPDFSSDLFSLQKRTNLTLVQLKNRIAGMKLGATATVISAVDWIAFKRQINDAVVNFVEAFNGTQTEEWKNMKNFTKKSFADLRDEIISLRDRIAESPEKSAVANPIVVVQAKKPKDFAKNGKNMGDDVTLFDWETLKTDVNATVQNLLDDIKKIVPGGTNGKIVKDSLMKAQNKFANLQLSPSLVVPEELPSDWAVFVNGVNKTLNSVIKKMAALKPVDIADSTAMKSYEKEVNDFFVAVKQVVEKKKTEFEAATSMGSSFSRFFGTATTIVSMWIVVAIL